MKKPDDTERSRKTKCRIRTQIRQAKARGHEVVLGVRKLAEGDVVFGPVTEVAAPTRGEQKK